MHTHYKPPHHNSPCTLTPCIKVKPSHHSTRTLTLFLIFQTHSLLSRIFFFLPHLFLHKTLSHYSLSLSLSLSLSSSSPTNSNRSNCHNYHHYSLHSSLRISIIF